MAWGAVWRRSLQLRVVISTLALSTAVVLVLGLRHPDPDRGQHPAGQAGRRAEPDRVRRGAAGARARERRPQPRGRAGRAQQRPRPTHELLGRLRHPRGGRVPRGAGHHGDRGQLQRLRRTPRRRAVGPAAERRRRGPRRAVRHGRLPRDRRPRADDRPAGAHRERRPGVLPALPARLGAAHAGSGAEHVDRRRARAAPPAGGHRQHHHAAGRAAGAARGGDRGAVRRRPPRRAPPRPGRGRAGPARRVVQRDGGQHPGADPAAGGVRRPAAAVHLRRQPRAAHAAHHRPDGRRRALRVPGRAPPRPPAQLGAAGHGTGPVRVAARRPAGDLPARRGGRRARARSASTCTAWWRGRSRPCAGSPTSRHPAGAGPADRGVRRRRSTPGRADRAQPGGQRDRPQRGQAGAGGARGRRARRRGDGPRPRGRPAAGGGEPGVQPVLAGRGVAGPAYRWHGPGAVHRRRGRPAARRLAAGLGRAGQGRGVPADAAAQQRRRADSSPLPLGPERDTPRRVGTSVPTPPLGWAPVSDGIPAGGAR